eukprot:CAMPEP_0114237424 /NCGR_PEP_ID=MMETSP0058-20121206/7381_1 /TAXON_ID=36894 /ORGANISM="Pyramimonas parkeae, CCMP726" /LENGTH=370 /DNA_ID=CAMNT_0001349461 /DNA_START=155 /DNA_END=1267 /DNA_ORIENTATION=+
MLDAKRSAVGSPPQRDVAEETSQIETPEVIPNPERSPAPRVESSASARPTSLPGSTQMNPVMPQKLTGGKLMKVPDDGHSYGKCRASKDCSSSRMSCIQGVCRCPVLFKGTQCEEVQVPEESWCLTPLKDWMSVGPSYVDLAGKELNFSTCAVVGSSGNMKGSGFGPEIDAHSAVFRFNEAPASRLYRPDVGSFTTLRFQNRDRSGFAEVKGEICVVRQGKWSRGQDSNGKCRFQQMPREVELYVDGHWKNYKQGANYPQGDVGRPWFSNGFTGIAFAAHMCARVDVYGFTFGSGYYFPKYRGPARSWGRRGGFIRPPAKEMDKRHSWIKESSCLKMLSENYPSQVTIQSSTLSKAYQRQAEALAKPEDI